MSLDEVLAVAGEALMLSLILTALPTLAALVVGLIIAIVQAATQVQEQTLTVVPKIVAVFAVLAVGGRWMVVTLMDFTAALFQRLTELGLAGGGLEATVGGS